MQLDLLFAQRSIVFCALLPSSLVNGDQAYRNAIFRIDATSSFLIAFDSASAKELWKM